MKAYKKKLFLALAFFIVFLCFFLFSYTPLETELILTPKWTSDISQTQDNDTAETRLPFRFAKTAGYFTPSGKIALLKNFSYKAAIKNFAARSNNALNLAEAVCYR